MDLKLNPTDLLLARLLHLGRITRTPLPSNELSHNTILSCTTIQPKLFLLSSSTLADNNVILSRRRLVSSFSRNTVYASTIDSDEKVRSGGEFYP